MLQTSDLPDGDATVRVEHSDYSDVNYKHGMAITGIRHRRIAQFFPSFPASISPVLLRTHDRRGSRRFFFGVRSRRMHYAMTGVLAAAMALVMVLIVAWTDRSAARSASPRALQGDAGKHQRAAIGSSTPRQHSIIAVARWTTAAGNADSLAPPPRRHRPSAVPASPAGSRRRSWSRSPASTNITAPRSRRQR
jgi:hypothetical protein